MNVTKPLFLIDECQSFRKSERKCKDAVWSVDVLGYGVSDNEVLEYAKKKKLIRIISLKYYLLHQHDLHTESYLHSLSRLE